MWLSICILGANDFSLSYVLFAQFDASSNTNQSSLDKGRKFFAAASNSATSIKYQSSPLIEPIQKSVFHWKRVYRHMGKIWEYGGYQKGIWGHNFRLYKKMDIQRSFTHWKTHWNTKITILNKMNITCIVYFCLGKYSFRLHIFSVYLVFRRKWMFHSLFISVLVNTASVFILFQHILHFEENECFIDLPLVEQP